MSPVLMGFSLHWLFAFVLTFGFVGALIWLYKYGDKKFFRDLIIIALVAGALGVIFTMGLSVSGWRMMMGR